MLVVIYELVAKDYKDVLTFAQNEQLDLLELLNANLEMLEGCAISLRQMLKEPKLHIELDPDYK